MDEKQKLKIAKVILIQNQPFYASLVMRMKIIPDESIETAQTDGKMIWYSPAFFDTLSTEEVSGVLAHEVMHIANLHTIRIGERELWRWNKACDYAINPLLKKSGLKLPAGCLLDEQYLNMSAEQIYDLLPPVPPEPAPAAGMGEVVKPPPEVDLKREELLIKQSVSEAVLNAQLKKKCPEHIERMVQELLAPKIDWQEVLARYLTEICKDDYCWTKPSPRYICQGLYLPVRESTMVGKIILIVDTSGSIDETLLNQFASEVQEIANIFSTPLQVMYVDHLLQAIQNIDPDDPIALKPEGGGGTDFRPGFEYIEEQSLCPKAVVYLTDGICYRFPEEPDYPVLWAKFKNYPFDPPFGQVIQVD